ncbi:hypothetical protein PHLCEN_2v899 [Hermanssonia centrifuga]|uniref:Uncharacterized protein n=1 Tax=Hermanssonia centrifuga TaxID=98765 RepID=A0A2R6S4P9_9APHY|nr:hypothetical protein PHLCEN_2v899 [Hermanssonia centrifuga]
MTDQGMVQWPGYDDWTSTIHTAAQANAVNNNSRLAYQIARAVRLFMDVRFYVFQCYDDYNRVN